MAAVTITIEGLDKLLKRLDGQVLLAKALRRAFDRTGLAVVAAAKERAPVDRGQLRAGITHQVDSNATPQYVEVGTRNLPYAAVMHEGRRPGSWPPPEPIAAWIKRKGITGEDGKPLATFVVQRSIARKGTKPRPFLKDGLAAAEPKIQGFFDQAAKEVEAAWQT